MRYWGLVAAISLFSLSVGAQPATSPPSSSGNPPEEFGHDRTSPIPPRPDQDDVTPRETDDHPCPPPSAQQQPKPGCKPPVGGKPAGRHDAPPPPPEEYED